MMFVTKKYHETRIKEVEEGHLSDIYHFESRIADLKSQISDLRLLVFPVQPSHVDPVSLEADAVLSGSDKPIELSEKEHNEILRGVREADMLLSGNYSEDLLQ